MTDTELLRRLRQQIDHLDSQILDLLKERLDIVKKIGDYKHQHSLPTHDLEREKNILQALRSKAATKEIDENFVIELWNIILAHCTQMQRDKDKNN